MSTNPDKTKVQIRVTEAERNYVKTVAKVMEQPDNSLLRAYILGLAKYYGPKLTGRNPTPHAILDKAIYRIGLHVLSDLAILEEYKHLLPDPHVPRRELSKRSFNAHTTMLPKPVSNLLKEVNDGMPAEHKNNLGAIMESIRQDEDLYQKTGIKMPYREDGYIDVEELDRRATAKGLHLIIDDDDCLQIVELIEHDAPETTDPPNSADA